MKRTLALLCCLVLIFAVLAAPASAAGDWQDIVMAVAAPGCTVALRSDGRVLYAGNQSIPAAREVGSWQDVVWIETQDAGKYLVGYTSDNRVYLSVLQEGGSYYGNTFDQNAVKDWQNIYKVVICYDLALGLDYDGGFYWSAFDGSALEAAQSCQGWPALWDIATDGYSLIIGLGEGGKVYCNDPQAMYSASSYWGGGSERSADWTGVSAIYCTGCGLYAVKDNEVLGMCGRGWNSMESLYIAPDSMFGLRYDGTVAANFLDEYFRNDNRLQQVAGWRDIMQLSFDGSLRYLPVGLRFDGTVAAVTQVDGQPYGEWNFNGWSDVRRLFSGTDFTLGLREDGSVLVTGGEFGTLGYLSQISRWNHISWIYPAVGEYNTDHIVGLKTDGTLVAAGDNSYGQCNVY